MSTMMGSGWLVSMNMMMIMVSWSSSSWFTMWMMMEVSSFMFIPLILTSSSVINQLNVWKYYLFQSIGSFVYLISFSPTVSGSWKEGLIMIGLMVKMGVPPFHGWVIQISDGLSWSGVFLLNVMQKMIPLMIIMKIQSLEDLKKMIMVVTLLMVSWNLNQSYSLRVLVMLSSVFNISWMLGAMEGSMSSFIWYFLCYTYTFGGLILVMWTNENITINSMVTTVGGKKGKMAGSIMVLMLMGMPPGLMFMTKVSVLEQLMNVQWMVAVMLGMLTTITMIMYLKLAMALIIGVGSMKGWKESGKWIMLNILPMMLIMFSQNQLLSYSDVTSVMDQSSD